jgi:hypothetical protein
VALELPFVSEARYVGRYGWITAWIDDDDCLEARARVDARELLAGRRPKRCLRAAWA